jgi:ABC-type uncharacterized transport system substrate-binding protein
VKWWRVLLGVGFLAAGSAGAQTPAAVPRIGLLEAGSLTGRAPLWEAFRQTMRELGHTKVVFEARGADGKPERLPALANELVRLKVDAIVTAGTSAAAAARQATATIPIVMATGSDPVGMGHVASLARPGGNVTGVTTLSRELSTKRLELARELTPGASRLAILGETSSSVATAAQIKETEAAGRTLGIRLHAVTLKSAAELDGAFTTITREHAAALLVVPSPVFFEHRRRLAELAVKHGLPTVHGAREFAEAGGLIAYGPALAEGFHRAAAYVDKILKGAKPADLPIEQPTKVELIVNLRTAKQLGVTIPPSVLLRADAMLHQ